MLKNWGAIPYKNKKERKKIFSSLRNEHGIGCKIWWEDGLLFYKYKVDPDVRYF